MERSESIKELVTALSKAQGEIGKAVKDVKNEFFKSKYADLASVVDAIREPLAKNGLSYTQISHDAENAVCIETMVFHSTGEWMSTGKLTIPVSKHDAQGFGSAMTYGRRYSLSAAFGVAPEEDDGNAATAAKAPIPESSKSIGKSEFDKMDAKRQAAITDLSIEVSDTFRDTGPEEAYDLYCQARDNLPLIEEQAALRSLLVAPIKTAFTKIAAARKAKPTADDLANTP